MMVSASWLLWVLTTMVLVLSTRNPAYILIALSSLFFLGSQVSREKGRGSWVKNNLRFLVTMTALSIVINLLFAHSGRTILFIIPEEWLLIGGNITLESLIYGMINGFVIGAIYLIFNVLNMVLTVKQITRLIPITFRPISIMATISLTFFPSIQQSIQDIREAQMLRGNRMEKLADWAPIVIPLIVSRLEKSIQLSESLTSRGFYIRSSKSKTNFTLIALLIGTLSIFSGWILQLFSYPQMTSLILYSLGAITIIVIIGVTSKQINITHYHKEVWRLSDFVYIAIILIFLLIYIWISNKDILSSVTYSPYPVITFPDISIFGIAFSILPLLPLIFLHHDKSQ